MTVSVLHQKVSAIADDPASVAAGEVVPSDWNASHNITMDSGFLLGRSTAGAGSAEEITVGSGLSLSGGTLSASGTSGVSSFSAGTTGFTPNTATTGDVTLAGTLAVANGGTGVTTSTGTGSVVLSTGPTFAPDVVMSGSSSNPILRITQTGAGHALLIEDEASVDATPVVVNNAGSVILGSTTQPAVGTVGSHKITVSGATAADASFLCYRTDVSAGPATFTFGKTRGTDPLNSGDVLGRLEAAGRDATAAGGGDERTPVARIEFAADGAPALDNMPGRITFQTTPSGSNTPVERMRIRSDGNIGIGSSGSATGKVFIGGTYASSGGFSSGYEAAATIPSGTTATHAIFDSKAYTQAAAFTLNLLKHYSTAQPNAFSGGSVVTTQAAFHAGSNLTGATNNYGFYSDIAAATNRWNFYANGTAQNYFAGKTFIGATTGDQALNVSGAVRVANITTANQTSAGTMDFTGGNLRFLCWGASGTQGVIQWLTGAGNSGATVRMTLNGSNNLGLATATFGTSATNTFSVANGTAPTTGVADTVQYYSSDLSAGNTIPSWYTEGTNVGTGTPTADRTIAVRFNGTVYYLLASTIP